MSFKAFLLEAHEYKKPLFSELSLAMATSAAKKYCKHAVACLEGTWLAEDNVHKYPLVRGDNRARFSAATFTRMEESRKSTDTSDLLNTLMSEDLPAWKEYPKRNRSLICANNDEDASDYGSILLVMPYDDVKLGVVPVNDIYRAFRASISYHFPFPWGPFSSLDNLLQKALEDLYWRGNGQPSTARGKLQLLDNHKEEVIAFIEKHMRRSLAEETKELIKNKTWFKILDEMLDPKENLFKIIDTVSYFKEAFTSKHELWFEGRAIVFKKSTVQVNSLFKPSKEAA